jgi:hypothetical protein
VSLHNGETTLYQADHTRGNSSRRASLSATVFTIQMGDAIIAEMDKLAA